MDLVEVGQPTQSRHPWELARLRFFSTLLNSHRLLSETKSYLDIGAGDAWFSRELREQCGRAAWTCWDSGYETPGAAQMESDKTMAFSHQRPDADFDVILMLDVLEHIEDDVTFLKETTRINLRRNGSLLISVPAWPLLYSDYDAKLRHFRRYTPSGIRQVIARAGLRIELGGGLFHTLLAARSAAIFAQKLRGAKAPHGDLGHWEHGPLITSLITAALNAESTVSSISAKAGLQIPGLSWWALCRQ